MNGLGDRTHHCALDMHVMVATAIIPEACASGISDPEYPLLAPGVVMMRVLFSSLLLLAATDAQALDCAPYNLLEAAADVRDRSGRGIVLLGHISVDEALFPEHDPARIARWLRTTGILDITTVPAFFDGVQLVPGGRKPLAAPVTVIPDCAMDLCGRLSGGVQMLVVQETAKGLIFEVGPCGGFVSFNPSTAEIDAVEACLAGGSCAAEH